MGKLIAEVQQIKAGGNFDGTTPTTDSDIDNGVKRYLAAATGGLFDLLYDSTVGINQNNRVRRISSIRLAFDGNTTSWTISITDGTTDIVLIAGTNETSVIVTDQIDVLPEEQLKIVTVGATGALKAEVTYGISQNSL